MLPRVLHPDDGRTTVAQPAAAEEMYPKVVAHLRSHSLSTAEIGRLTGVTERQVQRWASGISRPDSDSRSRLLELAYVVAQLREVYTEDGTEIWLHGRNRGLNHQRPIDLLAAGKFDLVLNEIDRLTNGAM